MKIDLTNIIGGPTFTKYRWFFAIGIFIFIVSPVLGPQINNLYDTIRNQDRNDRIEEESFIKAQYVKLESQIESLNERVVELTAEVAILNYEKRRDRAAFISAPVAIWTVAWNSATEETWLEEFNPAFERLIFIPEGIDANKATDKSWFELFAPAQAHSYNESDLKVFRLGMPDVTTDLYTLRRDGSRQYWQITKWPIRVDGKIVALRGIAVQINKQ